MNNVKTVFLLVALSGIFLAIGGLIFGPTGLIIAGVIALAMNFFSYWSSDKLVFEDRWRTGGHPGPGAAPAPHHR